MFEQIEEERQTMNSEFRKIALLFAVSGVAPVVLLALGLISANVLIWVYLAVYGTVLSCWWIERI